MEKRAEVAVATTLANRYVREARGCSVAILSGYAAQVDELKKTIGRKLT